MNKPLQRIFLLSHMRAYSSLIGHILGSHRAINGYYEMHLGYQQAEDLDRQLKQYSQQETIKPGSRYLFDKLLHNSYPLNLQLPQLHDAKILIALREPEQSIKSIVHLFREKPEKQRFAEPLQAIDYYQQRLSVLSRFARQHAQRYFYFDAEMLFRESDRTLTTLAAWLQLNAPLQSKYQTFSHTGKARAGDSSERIHSGKIITEKKDYESILLPQQELKKVKARYDEVRTILQQHAQQSLTIKNP